MELQKQWFAAASGGKMPLPPLPTGYTAVEAIEMTNTYARILIDIASTNVHVIKLNGRWKNRGTYGQAVLAGFAAISPPATDLGGNAEQGPGNDPLYWGAFTKDPNLSVDSVVSNEFIKISFTRASAWDSGYPYISLFNWRTQGVWTGILVWRSIEIINFQDETISLLQPCIRDADGKVGYFDRVRNNFWIPNNGNWQVAS